MSLKITENYIPLGHPNRPGIKLLGIKARIWHGTANLSSTAGDEMHQKYMGRNYKRVWNDTSKKYDTFESNGKPFVFGGAHVFIDKDSATITCPLDELVYGCADRQMSYQIHTPGIEGYKGQRKLSYILFNNMNNSYTWNIELCMNDMNAWEQVCDNAIEFVKLYMPGLDKEDYRHYDITNKNCPSPFVNLTIREIDPRWVKFKSRIREELRG